MSAVIIKLLGLSVDSELRTILSIFKETKGVEDIILKPRRVLANMGKNEAVNVVFVPAGRVPMLLVPVSSIYMSSKSAPAEE